MDPVQELLSKKSLWKHQSRHRFSFYCPLCRAERSVSTRPRPQLKHFAQVALCAGIITLATWQWFDWKGIVSFIPLWTAFEVIFRTRVRAVLNCSQCGFDPYLYLTDVQKARTEVEAFWRKKFQEKGIPYPEKGKPMPAAKHAEIVSENRAPETSA